MIEVTIKYYAKIKEHVGKGFEVLNFEAPLSIAQVYEHLDSRYRFPFESSYVTPALNNEYTESDQMVHDGDTLVFIPPVAGG